jgi:hypothetical protein
MPDLIDTQRTIAAALRQAGQANRALVLFVGDEGLVTRRLAIYRGNVLAAITKALKAAFPVSHAVVGEEFFDALAGAYWRFAPSMSGDLHDYGRSLADFVASFEPARELPYLPDLLRLEWFVHRAYSAPDESRLEAGELAAVPIQAQAGLRLGLLPGTALIESIYPIVSIWTIHQPGYDGKFEVDWSAGERALIARPYRQVTVTALRPSAFALYQAFHRGDTLDEALQCAQSAEQDCDLVQVITEVVAQGPISALAVPSQQGVLQ